MPRRLLRALLTLSLLVNVAPLHELRADDESDIPLPASQRLVHTLPIEYAFSFEQIGFQLPGKPVERVGLTGLRMNFKLDNHIYAGLGGLVAVTGNRGGFIIVGADVGYDLRLVGPLRFHPEFFLGGGGGAGVPTGGGMLLRPSAALAIDLGPVGIAGGYALDIFPHNGFTSGTPFGQIAIESDFSYLDTMFSDDAPAPRGKGGGAFRLAAWRFTPSVKYYYPSTQLNLQGKRLEPQINLVGLTIDHVLSGRFFTGIELFGAFGGGVGGYSSVTVGGGYLFPLLSTVSLVPRVQVGAAGGGSMPTGGGLIVEPSLAVPWQLTRGFAVVPAVGYLFSIDGTLRVPTASLGVSSSFGGAEADGRVETERHSVEWLIRHSEWRASLSTMRFLTNTKAAPATAAGTLLDINLLGIAFDYRFTSNFFLSASSYWPYSGNAGGFAAGLLGLGFRETVYEALAAEMKLNAGAAAGGGVPAGGGLLVQAMLGFDLGVTRGLSAFFNGGAQSFGGGLTSGVLETGLRLSFGMPIKSK